MVHYRTAALAILLASSTPSSVISFQSNSNIIILRTPQKTNTAAEQRTAVLTTPSQSSLTSMAADASSSFTNDEGEGDSNNNIGEALSSATNAAVDSIANAVKDEPDTDAQEIARRQELVRKRQTEKSYKVILSLSESSNMGIRLCQIQMSTTTTTATATGQSLDCVLELDLDTMEVNERTQQQQQQQDSDDVYHQEVMDSSTIRRRMMMTTNNGGDFRGLVVSSVTEEGAGWAAGVRPGDILKSTSATLGSRMWPKSTLEGVKSAITSRKAVSDTMEFEFQRPVETDDNQFELTLTRPIGFNLKETEDGYVEIIGFTPKASKLARKAVRVGDRILAVDSALGDRMWPVSTTEGLISSVTARLPAQKITFRFERPATVSAIAEAELELESSTSTTEISTSTLSSDGSFFSSVTSGNATTTSDSLSLSSSTADSIVSALPSGFDEKLLGRCQEIIKRYKNDEKYVNKFSLPGIVADKVVNVLASAGTKVDAGTLSMILTAYLTCRQPDMAIRVFEAVVGLRADAIEGKVESGKTISDMDMESDPLIGKNGKRIVPNTDALDVYTAGALMKAHALNGDLVSMQRVLSVLEGHGGITVGDEEIASWPGTGTGSNGSLKPDSHCYNIAITAASNSDAEEGLELAMIMFNRLSNPGKNQRLVRDVVSYNAIIKALTKFGQFEEAIQTFYQLKTSGIKPDKYTYTALAKAVIVEDSDVEELLYDMREAGVDTDVVTFNTIIRYLCEQRKVSAARKVVTFMEATGVLPDSWTYSFLMNGLLDSGNPSAALTLFESACSDRRTVGLTENVVLYTSAMTAAASVGDHTRALELLSRMNSLGIKPNIKTMTALLSACISSGEPDLAVDIFRRIQNPDSYAVMKGLMALSLAGKGDEALAMLADKESDAGRMKGKSLNKVYDSMLRNSIVDSDYELARRIVKSLIGKGNILSKSTFRMIFESMSLTLKDGLVANLSYSKSGLVTRKSFDEEDAEKFRFLLFLVDTLSGRNLPCEASLYATLLQFGNHLGGLPRKISALLVSAKAASGVYANNNMKLIDEGSDCETECIIGGWEDLFVSFDEIRNQIESPLSLPKLRVRVASRELSRVLRAERNLSFRKRSLV